MRHIFIDTETTGLGPFGDVKRDDQIIEIAFVWSDHGVIHYMQKRCNPGKEYLENAQEALDIQSRSMEEVLGFEDIHAVSNIIKEKLASLQNSVFHAWNIPFDRYFVEQKPWNLNLEWGNDPMVLASRDMGYSYDRIALWKAVDFYGIGMPDSMKYHHAGSDAFLAMRVWEAIQSKQRSIKRNKIHLQ